jgi:putative membrane protein
MMWGWNGGGWNGGGAWGLMSGLFMLVFLVVLVIGVVLVVRALLGNQSRGSGSWQGGPPPSVSRMSAAPTALEILEQRYAKGEIEREEFLARKRDLQS